MKPIVVLSLAVVAATYLFVTAPPPLPDEAPAAMSEIPVQVLLDTANLINATARKIYTDRIVTGGQAAGIHFGEDWQTSDVEAGPLPALFLRLVSTKLKAQGSSLGLFLGSDRPINPSNAFKGEQIQAFQALKQDRQPRYAEMPALGVLVALYADPASANGCVSCHNSHPDSPKSDWKLGDIMGATTWTYPRARISDRELRKEVARVYAAIEGAYAEFLDKTRRFREPPEIGAEWPGRDKKRIPDADRFMESVLSETAAAVVHQAVLMR